MAKIALSYQPLLINTIKLLATRGHEFVVLNTEFAQTLKNIDMPVTPLADNIGGLQDKAFDAAAKIIQAAGRFSTNGLGVGGQKFINEHLSGFLYPRLADMSMMILALDQAKPDMVIVHNDVEPLTKTAALWCKTNSIPCLHVPHAIYQDINRSATGTDVHDLITASHLAAAGPFQRQWFEVRGFSPAEIRETGLPQFDAWAKATMTRQRARRLTKMNDSQPVICYASTWQQTTNIFGISNEWQLAYLAFLDAIRETPFQIIVKCHPRGGQQNFQWHAEQAKQAGVKCLVMPQHLEVALFASDLLLVYGGSNTILEGSFVPGLRLATIHGYDEDEAVYKAMIDPGAIKELVVTALQQPGPSVAGLQAKYVGEPDGRASERIAEFTEEILCQSS